MFETTFDETFREVAQNRETALKKVADLEEEANRIRGLITQSDEALLHHDLAKIESRLADGYRLIGEDEPALAHYDRTIAFHADRPKPAFLAKLKRALVLAELSAEDPFEELELELVAFPVFAQFFYEFRARTRFKNDDKEGSAEDLQRALELRVQIGNQKHIEHTERWLEKATQEQ